MCMDVCVIITPTILHQVGWRIGNGVRIDMWKDKIPSAELLRESVGIRKLANWFRREVYIRLTGISHWSE